MSEPFLAEIRIVGFNFAPRGWAFCDGQLLSINQNQALFSLLGTTYGGDGRTTFALPGLRGRVPIHEGQSAGGASHPLGQKGGTERHALTLNEMPAHTHALRASSENATTNDPSGNVLARTGRDVYHTPVNLGPIASSTVPSVGGQAHENMQPFIVLRFCIALQGLFPSPN